MNKKAAITFSLSLTLILVLILSFSIYSHVRASGECDIQGWTGIYDGNEHGASGSCTGNGTLDLGETYTDVPGGYASWTYTDNDTGELLDNGTVSIEIDPADADCKITSYDLTYDLNDHSATGSCTGVNGEDLSGGLDLNNTDHTGAGSYNDTWYYTDETGNYNDQNDMVFDFIEKADADCQISGYTETYAGIAYIASGTCNGLDGVSLAGLDLSGTSHTLAGFYTGDSWSFTDTSGNYNDQNGSVNDEIDKANADCNVTGYDVSYDEVPTQLPVIAMVCMGRKI